MVNKSNKTFSCVFFLGIFILSLWLTFFLHKPEHNLSWKGAIWADKAGYYIYLPATFLYQFDVNKAPPGIVDKTGGGFLLDENRNKIYTKYTYGVALLLSPFFLLTHGIALLFNIPELGGFSLLYHNMVNLVAVIYLLLGLLLLKIVLSRYFNSRVQYFVLFLVYFGTNLLYYTVDETLMSHVYSFFLFSLYLFALIRFLETKKYIYFLLIAFSVALVVVIRPINVIILSLLIFWDVTGWKQFLKRVLLWLQPRHLIPFILIFILCILPQVFYWHYLTDNYIYYSYGAEGFSHWLNPRVAEVWFSPLNGLFLYTPLTIVMAAGMVFMMIKKNNNGVLLVIIFITVTYLCASWQTWYFGCSFGQRAFVEYFVLFSIPIGFVIQKGMQQRFLGLKIIGLLLLLSMVYFNIRMTLIYEKCFFGASWDWDRYKKQIFQAGLLPGTYVRTLLIQDFENQDFIPDDPRSSEFFHSGSFSGTFLPSNPISGQLEIYLYDIGATTPDTLRISFWAYKPLLLSTQTDLECFLIHEKDTLFQKRIPIDVQIRGLDEWCKVQSLIALPELDQWDARIFIQFRNKSGKPLFLDDIYVEIMK